ncbi:MAG: acyltransferase [Oceanisphaera sp.]|uniref:acyltransferase family protein n=1 Tax=Oceanisphaera sp. TaxID=1929979 RepID=UPI003C742152
MFINSNLHPYLKFSTLEQEIKSGKDLFSIFRLVASFMVLFAHAYHIYGIGVDPLTPVLGIYTGKLAVYIFFSISGFFIVRSAMKRDFYQYVISRVLRIYPALIVCNVITVAFIIPIAMGLDWYSFLLSQEAQAYVKINSLLDTLKFTISGVFENNPDQAINGSLWTLPVEIRAYIIALLLVMVGATNDKSRYNALLFVSILVHLNYPSFFVSIFPIPGAVTLMLYFFFGGALYINRRYILISPLLLVLAAALIGFFKDALSPVLLSALIVYLVVSSGYVIRRFINLELRSDYSYGCYLYAYPLSQLAYNFMSEYRFSYYLMFVVIVTFVFSFASWHLLEKPINSFSRAKIFPKINKIVHGT